MTSYTNFVNRGRIGMIQGSSIVTGTDTMFVTDAVEGGVLFVNGASHPVIEVIDETHLRIGSIWWLEGYDQNVPYFIGLMDSKAATGIWANQQLADMIARLTAVKVITDPFEQILELAQDGKLLGIATADPLQFEMIDALVTPKYDAQVPDIAGRAAYDAEAVGFAVLVNDTGAGRAAIFTRIGAAGGWTTPAYITGPAYLMGVGTTTGIPFGESPLVTQTTKPGGSDLNFFIPEGMHVQVGTTTTLVPGSDASVTEEAVVGGIRLNFFIPEGLPGTIESVSPYWLSRIQYDTNAAEARIGLGVTLLGDQLFTAADAESVRIILSAGDVNGPASSVSGRIALFSGTSGKLLTQAGLSISDLEPVRTLITQALAEGGTETAVKAWSSLRVRQNADAGLASKAIRFDAAQSLTPLQKSFARANSDSGILAGFRNKIINGDFRIAQRGESFSTSSTSIYGIDRWLLAPQGGATLGMVRGRNTSDSSIAGREFEYYADITFSGVNAANRAALFQQRIENVETASGRVVTCTFWVFSSTPRQISNVLTQNFGVGGSAAVTRVKKVNVLTGWTKVSVTHELPSISGKVLGTGHFLGCSLWLSSGTDYAAMTDSLGFQPEGSVVFARVSLVEDDATVESDPFSARHTQQELALCQRYYRSNFSLYSRWDAAKANEERGTFTPYEPMRVVPTVGVANVTNLNTIVASIHNYLTTSVLNHRVVAAAVGGVSHLADITLDAEL